MNIAHISRVAVLGGFPAVVAMLSLTVPDRLVGQTCRVSQFTVSVSDSGTGIAPEDLAHIFDRFYKARDSGGSGLGLTIAKNLVAAHGGDISATSTVGQGTTVRFTLPV